MNTSWQRPHTTSGTIRLSSAPQGQAIVIGAGFAGMLAAAVLAGHFQEVFLIEQDHLPATPEPRKSLPQAAHAHALLQSGHATLSRLFPGFEDRAVAAGGMRLHVRSQWRSCLRGRWTAPDDTGLTVLSQTRGLLDYLIRREISALPAIRHLAAKVCGLAQDSQGRVCGVSLQTGEGTRAVLNAALVIDASGRASQSDRWLSQCDFVPPPTETAHPEVRYVSAEFSRSVSAGSDLAGWLNLASAPQSHGGVIAPVENQRWIVTASTRFGDPVPTDEASFRAFFDALGDNRLGPLLRPERRLTEFSRYRVAATRIRRHDLSVKKLPPGYLPVGDVIASFNPVYGQGMSVSALQIGVLAEVLGSTVRADGWQSEVRDRFIPLAMRPAWWAWQLGLANDMSFPQFTASPSPEAEHLRSTLHRAFLVSTRSPEVRRALDRTLHLLDPPETVFELPVIAEAFSSKASPHTRSQLAVAPHERVL